MRLFQIG